MREFNALRKAQEGADDADWMRCSIVATAIINGNRDPKKSRALPFDAFVPKRATAKPAAPKQTNLEVLKDRARMWSAALKARPPKPQKKI